MRRETKECLEGLNFSHFSTFANFLILWTHVSSFLLGIATVLLLITHISCWILYVKSQFLFLNGGGGGVTPVFLTWTDFSALHLFKCGWRWSKPIAGLRQFCKNLWSGSAIAAAWGDVRLLFTEEERLPISTERKTAVAASSGCEGARMDSLCVACVYMQRFTCRGSQTRKLLRVYAPAHTWGFRFH